MSLEAGNVWQQRGDFDIDDLICEGTTSVIEPVSNRVTLIFIALDRQEGGLVSTS